MYEGAADADKIATFAKELIKLQPDAIIIVTTPRDRRACPRNADNSDRVRVDPIGGGFAASLAHPGSNITGFVAVDAALGGIRPSVTMSRYDALQQIAGKLRATTAICALYRLCDLRVVLKPNSAIASESASSSLL